MSWIENNPLTEMEDHNEKSCRIVCNLLEKKSILFPGISLS